MKYQDYNDFELLSLIQEGNEEANNIILKKYEPLINSIASKMISYSNSKGLEKSDLIQEGLIGLNSAIERFNENKDVTFFTYAKTCVERRMISILVSANRKKHRILNDSISIDDDELFLDKFLKDDSLNPEDKIINEEEIEKLISKIESKLTDFENQVFDLLISGFNYKEIAEILDRDNKSIDNAIQRLKSKVKKQLNYN